MEGAEPPLSCRKPPGLVRLRASPRSGEDSSPSFRRAALPGRGQPSCPELARVEAVGKGDAGLGAAPGAWRAGGSPGGGSRSGAPSRSRKGKAGRWGPGGWGRPGGVARLGEGRCYGDRGGGVRSEPPPRALPELPGAAGAPTMLAARCDLTVSRRGGAHGLRPRSPGGRGGAGPVRRRR